ncbi:MAG: MFS transporter, partial [Megasphaera elsdenii]|nr:MFS transporter [Megasphaera elsdenii]
GAASSVVSTVRLIGQVLSVAIITLILSQSGTAGNADWLIDHIQEAFIVFTILCAIGIVPSAARSK